MSETSIAAGIRRIEAVTGLVALAQSRQQASTLNNLARSLKVKTEDLEHKVGELSERLRSYDKELKAIRLEQVNHRVDALMAQDTKSIGGTRFLVKKIDAAAFPRDSHQVLLDSLASKLGNGVAFLTQVEDGNLALMAAVGAEARGKIKAGDLIKELSKLADGRGGGRPDKAQAGSKFPEKEPLVLAAAGDLIAKLLS